MKSETSEKLKEVTDYFSPILHFLTLGLKPLDTQPAYWALAL